MSQENYMGMAFRVNLEKNPDLMRFDEKEFAATLKKQRESAAKLNPPKAVPVAVELSRLRSELFDLQQQVNSTKQKITDGEGNIKLLEGHITAAIKESKKYTAAGNLLAARGVEHKIQKFESELNDARDRLVKEQHYSTASARVLRTWQTENGARLKELEKVA